MNRKHLLICLILVASMIISVVPAIGQTTEVPAILTLPGEIAGGRPVTISVSEKPSADEPENIAQWEAQAQRFMDMYPNVTIEGLELQYDPAAFAALIAGDQLPTLFRAYFTEPPKFIEQGAVADLTPYYNGAGVTDVFNPKVLDIMSRDGMIYGIPKDAYALGLGYNIGMLAAAGFDAPPETWDELVEMAVALTDRDNNVAGFAFINDGSGATGWHFTNIAYGFGTKPEDLIHTNEDGTSTATFGEGAIVDAMQFVKALRWTHDVLPGATLDWGSISEALVSDRVAMVIYAGDQFNFVFNQFPDADLSKYGYAAAPAGPDGRFTLTGGNLWMVSGAASADEQEAAAYYQFWRQFDPEEMLDGIEATTEAVGMPTLPMYVGDYEDKYQEFRSGYYKLPVENYAAFNNAVKAGEVTLVPELGIAVQDYYTEMGIVVSEVLSDESVDPATRLTEAAEEFQAFALDS